MSIAYADQETPFGPLNGVNPAFSLAHDPSPALSLQLVWNGVVQRAGVDFALSGSAVTFLLTPPGSNDTLLAWYRYDTAVASIFGQQYADQETPVGLMDNVNFVFTLAHIPSPALSLQLVWNGVVQHAGVDFLLGGPSTIVFVNSNLLPGPGDSLVAWYRYDAGAVVPGTSLGPTVDDLLRSSFRCINQLRPGFGHSNSERVDALFVLNAMLEGWATDDLNCYCDLIASYRLTPGKQSYTIGPGGDFDAARPVKVNKATFVLLTNPVQPLRLDLELLNAEQWQLIRLQAIATAIPQKCFYATTFPFATVNLWPLPTGADRIELSSSQMLSAGFTDGATVFSAPPGYLDAVRYNLAVRLAMEFNQPLKPGVAALASETLAKIQRLNDETPLMTCNPGVLSIRSGRSGFNWRTGD